MARAALAIPEPETEVPEDREIQASPRVVALHAALMETLDPAARARIHVELGSLALQAGGLAIARRHFQEALVLDPRLDTARRWLAELARRADPEARPGLLRGLMDRLSRK